MPAGQKRAPDLITDGCEPPRGCRELNSGSLEEQAMLLTAEPSLQPPVLILVENLVVGGSGPPRPSSLHNGNCPLTFMGVPSCVDTYTHTLTTIIKYTLIFSMPFFNICFYLDLGLRRWLSQ